jgi:hypothetical protein
MSSPLFISPTTFIYVTVIQHTKRSSHLADSDLAVLAPEDDVSHFQQSYVHPGRSIPAAEVDTPRPLVDYIRPESQTPPRVAASQCYSD